MRVDRRRSWVDTAMPAHDAPCWHIAHIRTPPAILPAPPLPPLPTQHISVAPTARPRQPTCIAGNPSIFPHGHHPRPRPHHPFAAALPFALPIFVTSLPHRHDVYHPCPPPPPVTINHTSSSPYQRVTPASFLQWTRKCLSALIPPSACPDRQAGPQHHLL